MDIVKQVQDQLKTLNEIRSKQQQLLGQKEALLKQLQDKGYETVDLARQAIKELEEQNDQVGGELTVLSKEMAAIINRAHS